MRVRETMQMVEKEELPPRCSKKEPTFMAWDTELVNTRFSC